MRRLLPGLLPTVLLLVIGMAPASAQEVAPPPRTITVVTTAEVEARPDRAVMQLGVETQASTAQEAMAQNNARMAQVITALMNLGITEANLQTSIVDLQPVYSSPTPNDPNQSPQLVGFRATNIVSAELEDLTQIAGAIDAGITAGANRILGIGFRLVNEAAVRQEALRTATARARPKAEAAAAGAGVTLGTLDAVMEMESTLPPFAVTPVAESVGTTPVLPGMLTVRATVQVRFNIQ